MADEHDDPRFDEIEEEVDEIRRRIPHNPGLGIPDPDVEVVVPSDEDRDDADPPSS